MRHCLALLVSIVLGLRAVAGPIERFARQTPPGQQPSQGGQPSSCNLAGCLLTIGAGITSILPPCQATGAALDNIQRAQSRGQQPAESDVSGFASNSFQCVAQSVAAGLQIPAACMGCPGSPQQQ